MLLLKQHANFPQFLEEDEDSPMAVLFNPKHELTVPVMNRTILSSNYNIDHEMDVMEEDDEEEETTSSLMDVETKSKCNQHQCMLPQVPQKQSAYLWSGMKNPR